MLNLRLGLRRILAGAVHLRRGGHRIAGLCRDQCTQPCNGAVIFRRNILQGGDDFVLFAQVLIRQQCLLLFFTAHQLVRQLQRGKIDFIDQRTCAIGPLDPFQQRNAFFRTICFVKSYQLERLPHLAGSADARGQCRLKQNHRLVLLLVFRITFGQLDVHLILEDGASALQRLIFLDGVRPFFLGTQDPREGKVCLIHVLPLWIGSDVFIENRLRLGVVRDIEVGRAQNKIKRLQLLDFLTGLFGNFQQARIVRSGSGPFALVPGFISGLHHLFRVRHIHGSCRSRRRRRRSGRRSLCRQHSRRCQQRQADRNSGTADSEVKRFHDGEGAVGFR